MKKINWIIYLIIVTVLIPSCFSPETITLSEADRELCCLKALEKDESLELTFIRKPALDGFINESVMAKAEIEARYYS